MVAVIRADEFDRFENRESPFATAECDAPVVVVGTGPAGARTVQELTRRMPHHPIVWCGAESCEPYNRVHLSSLLSGELSFDRFGSDYTIASDAWLDRRFGCEIVRIERAAKHIVDARNRVQRYRQLILATGSTPRLPNIPNISLPGIYTFRNFADAQALSARSLQSRRTLVIGGGLLGLEAAKAMHRANTEVVVVEYAARLMARQLDESGALVLKQHIEALGIKVLLSAGVREILGEHWVSGVRLTDDSVIECDTIIVAVGISANIELARRAGLSVGTGIHIDDETRTSDPDIYAVGECAEHRGVVYGLAAPGIEQATVAASVIGGETATYDGTLTTTSLKVIGVPVFSIGQVLDEQLTARTHTWSYASHDKKSYARLVTRNGRLVGATAVGDIADVGRLQDAVAQQRVLWFWQLGSFLLTGRVWSRPQSLEVAQWSATTTVCNCMGVTRGQLTDAMGAGCTTVAALAAKTGASSVCGSCRPLLAQLANGTQAITPAATAKPLLWLAGIAAMFAALWILPWSIPYSDSVATSHYDVLWRDAFWKQVTGYTLLAVSTLALVLSGRKRIARFRAGDFAWWRVAHVALGVLAVAALIAHTGGRFGSRLNLALLLSFVGLIAAGAYASWVIAREHRLGMNGVVLRRRLVWLHILLFWPLPLLLTFHVLQTYYF